MSYSKYDSYDGGSSTSTDFDVDPELKVTPYTQFEGTLDRAFGSNSPYGHSLGVPYEDVEIVDGALFVDLDADDADDITLKLFSWEETTGFSIAEAVERGEEPSVDDVPNVLPKTYGDTRKRYGLVGARIMPDEDAGVEAQSLVRDFEFVDGEIEFGDTEDAGGDKIDIGDAMMWLGTSDDGPTATARRAAALLTRYGEDAVASEDELDWLVDTSGDNILREQLRGRRVRHILITQQSEENEDRSWYKPIFEDVKTGEQIVYNNDASEGEEGN